MNNNNVYLFDDHKGNKALVITKGDYTSGLVKAENCFSITDPAFTPTAERLRQLLDNIHVKNLKGGDEQCK